jgi:hypothetical protein
MFGGFIGDLVGGIGDAIGGGLEGIGDTLGGLTNGVGDLMQGDFSGFDDAMHDAFSGFDDAINNTVGWESLADFFVPGSGNALRLTKALKEGNPLGSIRSLASMFGAPDMGMGTDMPDTGSLGGNMADSMGETSATLGGDVTPTQAMGNSEISSLNNYYGGNFGTESGGMGGTSLPTIPSISGVVQGNLPSTAGDPFDQFKRSPFGSKVIELLKPGQSKMSPGNAALGAGMGLYGAISNHRALSGQRDSLRGLYGQNSPYAKALREQLNRRDAAAGRRSQYGPREVELQAKLAQMAGGLAPTMSNITMAQNQNKMRGLQDLYKMAQLSGIFEG